MFSKAQFALAVILSTSLLAAIPQFGQAEKFAWTGDDLTQEDGPFLVFGYNNDIAQEGTLQGGSFDSLAEAKKEAARYVSANANRGGRAEIYAYTQTPKKTQTISLEKPPKKGFKEEKKAEPISDLKPSPFVGVKPYNPPDNDTPKEAKLVGTKWLGKYKRDIDDDFKFIVSYSFDEGKRIRRFFSREEVGEWKVQGNKVTVSFSDGTIEEFVIQEDAMTGGTTQKGDPRDNSVEYRLKKE